MLDHQIDRGVWKKRRWGLIFIKGARCFEVKKAINHELEAHGYGGLEEENGDGENGEGGGQSFEGEKGKKCWLVC